MIRSQNPREWRTTRQGDSAVSDFRWVIDGFERSHAFVPQITMVLNFRDRSITSGTAVCRSLVGISGILLTVFRAIGEGASCTGRV